MADGIYRANGKSKVTSDYGLRANRSYKYVRQHGKNRIRFHDPSSHSEHEVQLNGNPEDIFGSSFELYSKLGPDEILPGSLYDPLQPVQEYEAELDSDPVATSSEVCLAGSREELCSQNMAGLFRRPADFTVRDKDGRRRAWNRHVKKSKNDASVRAGDPAVARCTHTFTYDRDTRRGAVYEAVLIDDENVARRLNADFAPSRFTTFVVRRPRAMLKARTTFSMNPGEWITITGPLKSERVRIKQFMTFRRYASQRICDTAIMTCTVLTGA